MAGRQLSTEAEDEPDKTCLKDRDGFVLFIEFVDSNKKKKRILPDTCLKSTELVPSFKTGVKS